MILRMIARSSFCLAAAALLAGCETTQDPQVWSDLRLPTTQVWSGGEVQLVSTEFAGSTLPSVSMNGNGLSLTRINDSTVAAQLPDGNGVRDLRVELAGFVAVDTQITLHGFRSAETGPFLSGFLQYLAPQPWVLGAGDTGLVEVDVRTNTVLRQWPDSVHSSDCTWGVGPSVRAGHYVFFGKIGNACTHPWVWQYGPTLTRVDSLFGVEDTWSFAEIGPGGTVGGSDDYLTLPVCDSAGCAQDLLINMGGALTGVTVGRTAGRAILHSLFGWLVDAASGDTLRRITWLLGAPMQHVEGVVFTPAEDTAYALVSQWGNGPLPSIWVVDPADGALLDTLIIPDLIGMDLASDPVRPWLYVFAVEKPYVTSGLPVLRIIDRATHATVATLRGPVSEAISLSQWHQFRIVLDPAMDAAYVVATVQVYNVHGVRPRILRFDLVP